MRRTHFLVVALLLFLSACQTAQPQPATATPTSAGAGLTTLAHTTTPTLAPPTATPRLTVTTSPTATITPPPQGVGPANFPAGVNPLTGLAVANPQLLERRPLAVKVQLFPRGQRPPWGLTFADIVYDYYQNNGLARLHAIFYGSDADQVGPIRSARLLDGVLVRSYKSIFAFGGADRRVLNRLFNTEYADRLVVEGSRCPPMCRIDPNVYNFLVTNTKELSAYITAQGLDNKRPNLDGMLFQFDPPDGGQPGNQVQVRYSISAYTRWDYDPVRNEYLRFQDDAEDEGQGEVYAPLIDRLNEQQISAENVVVLFATHQFVLQSGSNEIVDIFLEGSGQAVIFRDGQAYRVLWSRSGFDALLSLTYPDGRPFPFKHGNTWFEVIGASSLPTRQEQAGVWRFENRIP